MKSKFTNLKWFSGTLFLVFLLSSLSWNTQAQNLKEITGTVYDSSSSNALSGVSIHVKGSTRGGITNEAGEYSVQADNAEVLVFSFIGYETKQVSVGNQTMINVALESNSTRLTELIAVGYQTKTRGEITSAVSSLSGSDIVETSENNITQAIQGKIPGVVVNDRGGAPGNNNADFLIRGKSTLGNNAPLIVIDGVPRSTNDFAHIAPNDIESISVLKDASAAIYGARAANGVILITTKKGSSGKSIIKLSSSYGIQSLNKFPKVMNSFERATYFNEFYNYNGLPPLWSEEALEHFKKGDEPLKYPNTDWKKVVVANKAPQTHHNLSVEGGNEKIKYFISGDLLYKKGLIKSGDQNYRQFQLRSNIEANITKDLKVGMNLVGRKSKYHAPGAATGLWGQIINNYPWVVARWPNGTFPSGLGDFGRTPVTAANDEYSTEDQNHNIFNSVLSIEFKIPGVSGLKLSGYASFDTENDYSKVFHNIWHVYDYDPETGDYTETSLGHSSSKGTRDLTRSNNFNTQSLYHGQISYTKSFRKHDFSAFVAYEQSSNTRKFLSAYRQDLPTAEMPFLFAGGQDNKDNDGFFTEGGRVNYFGSMSYSFSHKYMLDFTLRNDGSFNFAKGHRFGLFPAVSAGWAISEESFMDNTSDWLDNLKLRASWGKMGNDRVPSYQYLTVYTFSDTYAFGQTPSGKSQLQVSQVANPNITWETSYQTDIGLDLTAWESSFNFSLDVFSEKRKQILVARHASVPDYTALSLPDENLGKVDNKGIELSVGYRKTGSVIGYHFRGNLTYNKNTIIFMDEAKDIPDYQRKEGHPMDSWLVYETDGIFQTQSEIDRTPHFPGSQPGDIKYVDVDGDGEITGNDKVRKYTSPTPRVQFGFNTGVSYGGFSLDLFFQGQAKAQQNVFYSEGHRALQTFFVNRWTPDHPNSKFPRPFDRDDAVNIQPSTMWLYNASFLRLKTARLMYTLPKDLIPQIASLDVYISGKNLITWDSMIGDWDPERTGGSGYGYPQIQTITFGIDIAY